jgi:ADP-dependent NAD(P)H-hydrate dehydratase / NAD(P)H-hydrate epimerase
MRILTCDEIQQAEQQAVSRPGMSPLVLIQRAGYAVAQFCVANFKFRSVCVVCGRGKNGASGMVAAESLGSVAENVSVIVLAKEAAELEPDTAAFVERLSPQPIWISEEGFQSPHVQEAFQADLIVDAIAGGSKAPLTGLEKQAVEAVNEAFGTVVSVDVPSGVDADATVPLHEAERDTVFAHGIVTFVAPRPAHVLGDLTSGPIAVSELGVQPALVSNKTALEVITGQEVGMAFPPRMADANKGDFGHVLVIAGSVGKSGAAGLAGLAALRTGAGLVTVACPKSIQAIVAGVAPELMTEGLPETEMGSIAAAAVDALKNILVGKSVVVLGPGLSQHEETVQFVRSFVQSCTLPLVLDADGLNAFAGRAVELKPAAGAATYRVLTPHPGEAARLMGISVKEIQADRLKMARRIGAETGSCVVLKGWRTTVAGASGETWINMSGNPALAKGGSGDVLSGMIGAALARRHRDKQSATHGEAFLRDASVAAAVHLHGMAGDLARDELHENTVIARDVMGSLSEAFHDCDLQVQRGLFYLQR